MAKQSVAKEFWRFIKQNKLWWMIPLIAILLAFAGFMLFNFMTNLGPNAQTYLLAGEVFPTRIRGKGAGFAAAVAKIGAVLTAHPRVLVLDEHPETKTTGVTA